MRGGQTVWAADAYACQKGGGAAVYGEPFGFRGREDLVVEVFVPAEIVRPLCPQQRMGDAPAAQEVGEMRRNFVGAAQRRVVEHGADVRPRLHQRGAAVLVVAFLQESEDVIGFEAV